MINLILIAAVLICGCKIFKETMSCIKSSILIAPLFLSLLFYTILPVGEQCFNIVPIQGESLAGIKLTFCLVDVLAVLGMLWLYTKTISWRNRHLNRYVNRISGNFWIEGHYSLIVVLIIAGIAIFVSSVPGSFSFWIDYKQNQKLAVSSAYASLPLSKSMMALGCSLYVLVCLKCSNLMKNKIKWIIFSVCLVFPFFLAIATADKDPILYIVSALFVAHADKFNKWPMGRFAVSLFVAVAVLYCGLYVFSWQRGYEQDIWGRLKKHIRDGDMSITAVDPGGPYAYLSFEYNKGLPDKLRLPLFQRLLSIVPKTFISERPMGIDQVGYAWYTSTPASVGQGMGWHPMAEMRMYLMHYIGAFYILVLIAFGELFVWLLVKSGSASFIDAGSLCVFATLLISHRGQVESTFKTFGVLFVVLALCTAASRLCCLFMIKPSTRAGKVLAGKIVPQHGARV